MPELKRNLFFIGTINDKKFSFHAYQTKCEIRDSDGKITSLGVRHGKLFRMLFTVKVPTDCNVAKAESDSRKSMLKLWHERMGHLNVRSLLRTSKCSVIVNL